ncbi:hypothetical protein [Sphingomonas lutea]|uniref:hypothetical protein n=1 Tax=Sphingomonas lutea TaxID=1045317 RepID=UPI001CB71E55|nr:hypothetical protein [Sphingomonas lutea]
MPARHRGPIEAVFAIDGAMGDVLRSTSDPMLGRIRLAWWRERLEDLDQGKATPGEPRLEAVAHALIPRGVRGHDLAALEDGWLRLLDDFPWDAGTAEAIWFRGRLLFALGAQMLGRTNDEIEGAGGLWALVDAARHCSDAPSRDMLVSQARTFARGLGGVRFPVALRPLSMLAALAARDCRAPGHFEREGTARRAAALLRHRVTGRIPRA